MVAPWNIVLKWSGGKFYDDGAFFNCFTGQSA
jgi:hypothetical protein